MLIIIVVMNDAKILVDYCISFYQNLLLAYESHVDKHYIFEITNICIVQDNDIVNGEATPQTIMCGGCPWVSRTAVAMHHVIITDGVYKSFPVGDVSGDGYPWTMIAHRQNGV